MNKLKKAAVRGLSCSQPSVGGTQEAWRPAVNDASGCRFLRCQGNAEYEGISAANPEFGWKTVGID